MGKKSKEIDTYISQSAGFAQPILRHLRKLVHEACPEAEEKIKWSFPHFDYKNEMMCSMASFKQHCSFGFWKAALMKDKSLIEKAKSEEAMGHLGRICSLEDLPADKKILGYIKEAMKLNEEGRKLPVKKKIINKELDIPEFILTAVNKNKKAGQVFNNASFSFKKEYIQWITEAKTAATRETRLATAIEWIAEGKGRNWKYERK
jgi:uncharacterized protein YdeI (YjbR/CyaY-like superfamily)